jgi:hypothetical protein
MWAGVVPRGDAAAALGSTIKAGQVGGEPEEGA